MRCSDAVLQHMLVMMTDLRGFVVRELLGSPPRRVAAAHTALHVSRSCKESFAVSAQSAAPASRQPGAKPRSRLHVAELAARVVQREVLRDGGLTAGQGRGVGAVVVQHRGRGGGAGAGRGVTLCVPSFLSGLGREQGARARVRRQGVGCLLTQPHRGSAGSPTGHTAARRPNATHPPAAPLQPRPTPPPNPHPIPTPTDPF